MDDKPVGFLVGCLVVAPLCSICVLGPAAIGGFLGGWFGWIGDLGGLQIVTFAVVAAILCLGVSRYWRAQKRSTLVDTETNR